MVTRLMFNEQTFSPFDSKGMMMAIHGDGTKNGCGCAAKLSLDGFNADATNISG